MKKITPIFLFLISFILIPNQIKGGENKFVIGINTGYSFGLTDRYKEEIYIWPEGRGYTKDQRKLNFHMRGDLQYYFSPHWAIQGEIDYQRKMYTQEYINYNNPSYNYSNSYDNSLLAPYLNVIYNIFRERNLFPYFSAGVGVIQIIPEIVFTFKIGGGIKYYFFPRTALNLDVSFNVPFFLRILPLEIEYLSLNIGLEYKF